jgi:Peptidase family M1 domain/Peptidase M1 N-terminal domain
MRPSSLFGPITLLMGLPLCASASTATLTRSDSLDILHTRIELDLRSFNLGTLNGKATLRFVPKVNGITTLPLDLLQLHADSVFRNGSALTFTHVGEDLRVALNGSFGPADTLDVDVYYSGDPVIDASGWGGFYTLSSYQYDLGVAFDALPHSFGRSWFPCFDNFVERCTFEFIVTTAGSRTVYANGELLSETDLGGGERRTHWRINEAIPSYLASVASTNYVVVRDTFPSIAGNLVPVTLVARPQDTTQMKSSFIHLQNAFDTFERWFGPYRWERVGYCLTSQGAMEHPTNICYPDGIADGTLQYESIMAHELGHHWFGDLITCRRAEEMYINEGFAEYLSYLFLEDLYGRDAYMSSVERVHHDMIVKAHLIDEGWYALADVPQAFTYGEHTYRKGADFIHSLRGYLGDTVFAEAFTRVLTNNAFSDMSTEEFRDSLSVASGMDLTDYFADWIQQPGWAAFEVDSMRAVPNGGTWTTTVHVQQKLRHADHLYHNVPVTLSFESATGARWNHPVPVVLSDALTTLTSDPPFEPVFAYINADRRLALGTTVEEDTLTNPQTNTFALADVVLVANTMAAPSPLRVEEFWTGADDDTAEPFAFQVSPDRWWRVTGQLAEGADVDLRVTLDGRPTSSTLTDPGLVQDAGAVNFIEDSLVLLYRPNPFFPWAVLPGVELNFLGDHTNGNARLTATHIALGDYCMAWRKSATGLSEPISALNDWRFYPNPANDRALIEAPIAAVRSKAIIQVCDAQGRLLMTQPVTATRMHLDLANIGQQTVFLSASWPGGTAVALGPLVIRK